MKDHVTTDPVGHATAPFSLAFIAFVVSGAVLVLVVEPAPVLVAARSFLSIELTTVFPSGWSMKRRTSSTKAMKLGTKGKDVDQFVDQLKSEGESKKFLRLRITHLYFFSFFFHLFIFIFIL